MPRRLLIVEDHALMAQSLAAALKQQPDLHVAVTHVTGKVDVVSSVGEQAPDLVLLDLDLGEQGSATPLIEPIRERGADVVIVTGVEDPMRRAECVEAGAIGVIRKSASFDELLDAVREALTGGPLLTKHERDQMLAELRAHRRAEQVRLEDFAALTMREQEVLSALMAGQLVRDIARDAVVSVSTVRTQVQSILTKLGVRSQVAAIARAQAAGWRPGHGDR